MGWRNLWLFFLLFQCSATVFIRSAAQTTHNSPYPASTAHQGPAWFEDKAQQAGLTMLHVNGGVTTKKYIIETTGSGVAVIDYDTDGWPDLYFANGTTLD